MIPDRAIPKKPSAEALKKASDLIVQLERALETDGDAEPILAALKEVTSNQTLIAGDYLEISAGMSYTEAATMAFAPKPDRIDGLSFAQFEWIAARVIENITTDLSLYWHDLFVVNANAPDAADLLYYPPEDWIADLIDKGEIAPDTTWQTFQPTAAQLAARAWHL